MPGHLRIRAAAGGCFLAALMAAPAAMGQTLYFTAIPGQNQTELRERFDKVADYFESELDIDARYVPVKSYAAAVTAFRNNQVQLAWFGGLSGVRARQAVPGAQAIAQGKRDKYFHTYFIAHQSTGIARSEDGLPDAIQGKTFTFGSKSSTSGRLMPQYHIQQHFGKTPEDVFSRVGFSGAHHTTIDVVESGAYKVGAVNYTVWDEHVKDGKVDTDRVHVIWETPAYPDYNWTVRGDVTDKFGEDFIKRLQTALLELKDEEILNSFPRETFVKATNEDYEAIRQTARKLGLISQ
jgi:phosphonate transport system substrate-binding protein